MIGYAEYSIILDEREVSPGVDKLINGWQATGTRTNKTGYGWQIFNASEEDQRFKMAQIEKAWAEDMPDEDREHEE